MKRRIVILSIIALIVLGIAIVRVMNKDNDINCSDLKDRYEAEKFFNIFKEDIYGLDKDKDGIPCEKLPYIKYF